MSENENFVTETTVEGTTDVERKEALPNLRRSR